MKLLVCVLHDTERLNDLLAAMAEIGVSGATVLESQGMARILSGQAPVFAGFRHLVAGDRPFNYTIFSVFEDDTLLENTLKAIKEHLLPGTQKSHHGIAFTVPVDEFIRFDAD